MSDRLLLVEDTPSLSMLYRSVLTRSGHGVACAFNLAEARAHCERTRPSLVLLDLQLPDGDGLDLLATLRRDAPETRTIVITANGSINRAVQAMRAGAFDFLVKPFDEARLLSAVENALASAPDRRGGRRSGARRLPGLHRRLGADAGHLPDDPLDRPLDRDRVHHRRERHRQGGRRPGRSTPCRRAPAKPFVPLNCAAIPRDLLESEVFGHLKGAFTGALSDKPGAAAVADGGTLFLDEICEMDLSLQTKLLRFLQTSTIQPVGAARPIPVDVRIVCATNRDPAEEVRAGRFREDLYYRLHVVPIHMPPLRARPEDIMEIARASLLEYAAEEGKSFTGFEPGGGGDADRAALARQRAPAAQRDPQRRGAARRPAGASRRCCRPRSPARSRRCRASASPTCRRRPPGRSASTTRARVELLVGTPLADVERELIEATIAHCDGSIPRAARVLGVSPSTLYRKLESWTGAQRRSGT